MVIELGANTPHQAPQPNNHLKPKKSKQLAYEINKVIIDDANFVCCFHHASARHYLYG